MAALDEFGNLLDQTVIHLIGNPERKLEGRGRLVEMIRQHQLTVVRWIGNGTACRETEELMSGILAEELADAGVAYVVVNEAGASVYSTSPLGREEFPEYDATLRGAISIGRRIQDPLSELVKIDPASIGVGMYQHDVKAKHLRVSLDDVVESCVNFVGVDLNTASPALLRYVSGLNQLTARRVYDYRTQHGPFRNREQLKEVPGFGESAFVQSAGFLKIGGGDNPLDATWIHPESYSLACQLLEKMDRTVTDLADKDIAAQIAERAAHLEPHALTAQLDAGEMLLKDILAQLARPGLDPREDLPPPIFKKGVIKLDDLSPGMELAGTVLNVVDFGAFVDIGLHDTGLVHISQLANRYVRDPHDVVSVGDIVKVWVHEIDKTRRRVSLTMIAPGTQRTAPPRREKRKNESRRGNAAKDAAPAGASPEGTSPEGTVPDAGAAVSEGAHADQARPAPTRDRRPERPQQSRQHGGARPAKFKPRTRSEHKPKPLVPLTTEMKAGKAPLRTFGDLKQFLELKPEADAANEPSQPEG